MSRKKFCITAICGDEEKWIEKWSKSMMRTRPDYIVINLTQFADRSEELLRKYIPENILILVKNKWEDNFSLARNQGLDHVPDGMDWLAYFDMDEVITEESYEKLEELLNSGVEPCLVLWDIFNKVMQKGMTASLFYPRQWPAKDKEGNKVNARFQGTVHNQLHIDSKFGFQSVRFPLAIWHEGYCLSPEEMKKKHLRSETLLRKQIEEDPKSFFPRLNLAQLLRAKGDHKDTYKHAMIAMELVKEKMDRGDQNSRDAFLMSSDQIATSLIAMKRYDEAIEYADAALKIKPDFLDAIIDMSNAYIEKRDLPKAKFWLKRYLLVHSRYDSARDNTNLILNHLNSSFLALYHLGIVNAMEGNIQEATKNFKKSYDQQPLFRDTFVKYLNGLKIMNEIKLFNQEINKAMTEQPDLVYQIYELLGDIELEMGNIERSKFNMYQAVNMGEGKPEYARIKCKWDGLTHVFGDVSNRFFDTNKKQKEFNKKIEA